MHNVIQILGAYGGNSTKGGSTSFLLNDDTVIDAGNLLTTLKEKSAHITTVWLTHSHLDHIIDLAYILDNYYEARTQTLNIVGIKETIEALKKHFFNDTIWPDFSKIPLKNKKGMTIVYHEIDQKIDYSLGEDKSIEAFYGDHTVPSVGYIVRENNRGLLISSDTYSLEHIVRLVEQDSTIGALVVECSFPIVYKALAKTSKHLTAETLFAGLQPLENKGLRLYINHMKPEFEETIRDEINTFKGGWDVCILEEGDEITF